MRKSACLAVSALLLSSLPYGAEAQYSANQLNSRMERLERDISLLQRQLYREGGESVATGQGAAVGGPRIEIRLSRLEEQIRELTGKVEETSHSMQRMEQKLTQFQEEFDARMMATPMPVSDALPPAMSEEGMISTAEPAENTTSSAAPKLSNSALSGGEPMALYNQAFGLLNQARYAEAISALTAFTTQYPTHALIGNAYYWLGEAYYVQQDYLQAADQFRKGFEGRPDGPKAPDNLLKLGMALAALDKQKEACVVWKQLALKYPDASSAINRKVQDELKRVGCT